MWWSKIQIGIDLATSVTIFAAALTWWMNKVRERRVGVIDSARSTIIENINNAINEMALSFNDFATFTTSIERKINTKLRFGEDKLIDEIASGRIDVVEIHTLFSKSVDTMGVFYERGATLRYTIFPSLYSIGGEDEAVSILKKEINDVLVAYNKSQSGYIAYIKEITSICEKIKKIKASDPSADLVSIIQDEYIGSIFSIVDDPDYGIFLQDFLDDGDDDLFLLSLHKKSEEMTDKEKELRLNVAKFLIYMIANKPESLISQFLQRLAFRMQENRVQCKEFLVTLSAISSKMQQRSSDFSIKKAYDVLSSEKYFNTKEEIR